MAEPVADGNLHTRRRLGLPAAVAAGSLAVVGVGAVVVGLVQQEPAPPQPPASQAAPETSSQGPDASTQPSTGPTRPADGPAERRAERIEAAELTFSRPVSVQIPRIGVRSRLVDLGLDDEGVMETPEPVDRAGWFEPSPPPGIPGATVLAGHVTWNKAPSVFFRLGDLRRGDTISVTRRDDARVLYRVTRIGSFPKDGFPTKAVYDRPPRSELRLITCGGEYDEARNRYLANVIVWAEIVDVRA